MTEKRTFISIIIALLIVAIIFMTSVPADAYEQVQNEDTVAFTLGSKGRVVVKTVCLQGFLFVVSANLNGGTDVEQVFRAGDNVPQKCRLN